MTDVPSKIMLLINPISGTRDKSVIPTIFRELATSIGAELEIRTTSSPADAACFASEAIENGFDTIATAGGDGTVSDVASVIRGSEIALAIIPCGSGNGLARALGIPPDFSAAAKLITEGMIINCDNGLINNHPFFCTCGVGFDAEVSRRFATEKRRGRLTYIKNALLDYLSYAPQPYAISVDGRIITERAFLIAICNASQYGNNAYIAPHASLTDGLLDVTVVHTGSIIHTALAGVELFTGHLDRNTLIESFRVSSAVISRLEEGAAHIDGEPLQLGKRLQIELEPANLKVWVPKNVPEFKPIISPLRSMVADVISDLRFMIGLR